MAEEPEKAPVPTADVLAAYRAARREEQEAWRAGGHATHGAGPGAFGEWRSSKVDRELGAERQRGTGRGVAYVRPGLPEDEALRKGHRPHFWSSRLYGSAHGDWESEILEHLHPLAAVDPKVVYEALGGAWSCRKCHASRPAGQMHHCATCWAKDRTKWDLCDGCWLQLKVERAGGCTVSRLEEFEWEIRDSVHAANTWHDRLAKPPRATLTRILSQGDQGLLLGGKPSKLIAASNFQRLITNQLFGRHSDDAAPTEQEVRALFAKYGQTSTSQTNVASKYDDYEVWRKSGAAKDGLLPYEVFARSLLAGASVQLSKRGFRMGPLRLDVPADWPKQSMVRYPQCRRAVLPPSSWDGTQVSRSARPPKASLKLSNIFGYAGRQAIGPSLMYTRRGEAVYHVAAVAVVADLESKEQKFFQGHDNAITAMAVHPFLPIVATGQRVPKGSATRPKVLLWDSGSLGLEQELELGQGDAFVCALGFCGAEGEYLATVSGNEDHTLRLWDWRAGVALSEVPTKMGDPPLINGVRGNPYPLHPEATQDERKKRCELAVFGDGVLLFYWLNEETQELEHADPQSGNCALDTVFRDVCFLNSRHVLAAGDNGQIAVFYEGQGVQQVRNSKEPEFEAFHRPDGSDTGGILSMRTVPSEMTIRDNPDMEMLGIVTAGADGIVQQWDLEDFPTDLVADKAPPPMTVDPDRQIPKFPEEKDQAEYRPSIVSVDVPHRDAGRSEKLLAGDAAGCIWELDQDPDEDSELVVAGHAGDVMGVAAHPKRSELCATTCTDGCVYIWCITAGQQQLVRKVALPSGDEMLRAWSCSFSNDGTMLAVSTAGVVSKGAAETVDALPYSLPPVEGSAVVVVDVSELLDSSVDPLHTFAEGLAVGAAQPPILFETHDVGMVEVLRFSPDDRYLAVGGHQRLVTIFMVPEPEDGGSSGGPLVEWGEPPMKRCVGHSATILHLDWSALEDTEEEEGEGAVRRSISDYTLRSTSADYDIMHWDIKGRQQLNNQRDTTWHNWTSTLGFEVMGIWAKTPTPEKSLDRDSTAGYISEIPNHGAVIMPDAATINSLQLSPCGRYVVTGDDNANVRLLNYPCVVADAPAKRAGNADDSGPSGHSSFVTGVQWSTNNQFVLTAGGHDGTLFVWSVDHGSVLEGTARERWEERVSRAEFIAAPQYDGPRHGYEYRDDGTNGKGYYRASVVPEFERQTAGNTTAGALQQLRHALEELPRAELHTLIEDKILAEVLAEISALESSESIEQTSEQEGGDVLRAKNFEAQKLRELLGIDPPTGPHGEELDPAELELRQEKPADREELLTVLIEHEAAAMGPAGDGMARIFDEVIAAATKLKRVSQNVAMYQKKVEGQMDKITRRDREIAKLQAILAQVAEAEAADGGAPVATRDPRRARRTVGSSLDAPLRTGLGPKPTCGDEGAVVPIRALATHTAERHLEVTFREGEVLSLLRKESAEWWMAKLSNGQKGLVRAESFEMVGEE